MANINGTDISLMPNDGMKSAARRYKKWKEEGKQGGTQVAAARATQILSGKELSEDVVMRMFSFFSRHEVDKKAEGFNSGEDGFPSKGRVAWDAWGGDSGFSWSRKKSNQIKAARKRFDDTVLNEYDVNNTEETSMDSTLEKPVEEKAAPNELKVGDYVSWNNSGGRARGMIEKIERNGTIDIPDSSFTVDGTAEDPAALICIYRPAPSGEGYVKTDKLVGHKFSTLTKIDDLPLNEEYGGRPWHDDDKKSDNEEIQQFRKVNLKELKKRNKGKNLVETRELKADIRVDDNELYMSFSSEEPVQRYFGQEVLSHDKGAADLSRLNNGTAPFLWNHNRDEVLGVVQKAEISEDKRGYATIKWSRNPNAVEKRNDVEDGIISQVSFAYQINEIEERGEEMVVTKWKAMEISLVSVPADASVGVGRSLEEKDSIETEVVADSPPKEDAADLEQSREALTAQAPSSSPTLTSKNMEQKPETEAASKAVEAEQKRSDQTIIIAERNRSNAISAMGEKYSCPDLAKKLNQDGVSVEDARNAINNHREERLNNVEQKQIQQSPDVGLDQKEVKAFSFRKALHALANPTDRQAQEDAAFEREVSEAAQKTYGKSAGGILVPNEVLKRDLTVGSATAGGNLVATELLSGSFIEILRNKMAVMATNPTMLTGLSGNISIPRLTQSATGYWVGEGSAPSESQQAFDQVNMTPKTVAAYVDYSRRLLLQSSIDVESMIRGDLAKVIATKLDHTAIYGTGSSNQPLGIKDTTGVGTQTITTFGTFAEYIGMETDVAVANADVSNMFYLINASARGALKSTEVASSTGKFVFEDNEINGYTAIVSNQLANNDVLFGDFSQFVIGMWSGLDLTVDPYVGATSGNVRVIALQDVDFAVKQAGAFCFGT